MRGFEVDHPATQAWKRKRLLEAGLVVPASLTFVAVDFEKEDLVPGLLAAGFQPGRPAFFHWLGAVPYLRREAIAVTLRFIAGAPESEVVFDYTEPLDNYPPERRGNAAAFGARAAAVGEPWLSCFDPAEISRELRKHGFQQQEDLGFAEIAVRYLGTPKEEAKGGPGLHVIRAHRRFPRAGPCFGQFAPVVRDWQSSPAQVRSAIEGIPSGPPSTRRWLRSPGASRR